MADDREGALKSFIANSPSAMAMFDREMRYVAVSDRWKRDFNLDGDLIGQFHYTIFPEISEEWKSIHRRAFAGETLREDKESFQRSDGQTYWLKWEVRPWYRSPTEIGGLTIHSENLTELVNAEAAIRESETR